MLGKQLPGCFRVGGCNLASLSEELPNVDAE